MIDCIWTGMVCLLLVLSLIYALCEAEGPPPRRSGLAPRPRSSHPVGLPGLDRGLPVQRVRQGLTRDLASHDATGRHCRRRKIG